MGGYKLQELIGGHSGAENYEIASQGQRYMLKIFPAKFSAEKFNSIPFICNYYRELNIPTLRCLKLGCLSSSNQYFCIYNYIDGKNLEEIGEAEYDETQNYHLGLMVGEWLKILKNSPAPLNESLGRADIPKLTSDINGCYAELLSNYQSHYLINQIIGFNSVTQLHDRFNQVATVFAGLEQHPIHGDVKRSNIMRDKKGNFYLIDIESLKYGYDMLNFRHQMTWLLRPDKQKRTQFLKGVFDGLYNNTRPANFNEQLLYIYALNFFEHAKSHMNEKEILTDYLQIIKRSLPLVLNAQGNII